MKPKLTHAFIIILITSCYCTSIVFPVNGDNYFQDPVTAHYSPELRAGMNFTWLVKEWNNMSEWLTPNSPYEPKPGDEWTMFIMKDLESLTPSITGLGFYEFIFDPQNTPVFGEYFKFNISGYTFEETLGSAEDISKNWKILDKIFLFPLNVTHPDGQSEDANQFRFEHLDLSVVANISITDSSLSLEGSIDGKIDENYEIDFDGSIKVLKNFTYEKKPVGATLENGGWVKVGVKPSEFPDPGGENGDNGEKPFDFPDIAGLPLTFLGFSGIIAISYVLIRVSKKKRS